MPIYVYRCSTCSEVRQVFKRIADLNFPEECYGCKTFMSRQVVAPAVRADYAGYDCPITGKRIEGRRQHHENLRRHGCRILEAGEAQANSARKAREEADFDRAIEQTAEELVHSLPVRKREQLAAEMEAGVTAEVVRL